jgi:hypothetical protein
MAPSALKAKLRSRLLLQDKKTDKGVVSGTYSIHQTFILICNKVVNFSPLIIGKMFFGPAVMSLTQSEDFEDRAGVHDANTGVVVNIPGRYSLSNRYDSHGKRRVFVCRAINLSPSVIVLAAPAKGDIGERVILLLHHLGRVQGVVSRNFDQGFAVKIATTNEGRRILAAKIAWLEAHKNKKTTDHRRNGRFIPTNTRSKVILANGRVEDCFVLDLSGTGASVSADTIPVVGTSVALGNVVGRVVRQFAGGFAVQFLEPQSRESVEKIAILS